MEDAKVKHVSLLTLDGERIASATPVGEVLTTGFVLDLNGDKYTVVSPQQTRGLLVLGFVDVVQLTKSVLMTLESFNKSGLTSKRKRRRLTRSPFQNTCKSVKTWELMSNTYGSSINKFYVFRLLTSLG